MASAWTNHDYLTYDDAVSPTRPHQNHKSHRSIGLFFISSFLSFTSLRFFFFLSIALFFVTIFVFPSSKQWNTRTFVVCCKNEAQHIANGLVHLLRCSSTYRSIGFGRWEWHIWRERCAMNQQMWNNNNKKVIEVIINNRNQSREAWKRGRHIGGNSIVVVLIVCVQCTITMLSMHFKLL